MINFKKFMLPIIMLGMLTSCGGNTTVDTNTNSSDTSATTSSENTTSNDTSLDDKADLGTYGEKREMFKNPIELPLAAGSNEAADPYVFRWNGWYYLYVTSSNCIRGFKSKDLVNWEVTANTGNGAGVVSKDNVCKGYPYAPEITYFNGMFYLVTSVTGNGHFFLESTSPEGPFTAVNGANLNHSIDGSFFIDKNENIYMYYADGGCIQMVKVKDDFTGFDDYQVGIGEAKIGGWNEGPTLIERNGESYLTYTGSHYLSPTYRVDYAYAPKGSDISKSSSYLRMGEALCSTEDDFHALGHSSSFLGPDLDSYYMSFHNMSSGTKRYLNISRLSFNGSDMKVDDMGNNSTFVPARPSFESYDGTGFSLQNGKYLSNFSSDDVFSCEFNGVGEGKYYFSYVDDLNYGYITVENNTLKVVCVEKGSGSEVFSQALTHNFNISGEMHCYRVAYKDNTLSIYFDNMNKAYDINCAFTGGKIGYDEQIANKGEVGYLACSNVAFGSSDSKEYQTETILATNYDVERSLFANGPQLEDVTKTSYRMKYSKNLVLSSNVERATYGIYAKVDGEYDLNMRVNYSSATKKVKVKIDNGDPIVFKLGQLKPSVTNGDMVVNLGTLLLNKGQHNLSIMMDDSQIGFSEITINETLAPSNFSSDFSKVLDENTFNYAPTNLATSGGSLPLIEPFTNLVTKEKYGTNVELFASFQISSLSAIGNISFLMGVTNYGNNVKDDADAGKPDTYDGIKICIDSSSITLYFLNFNYETSFASAAYSLKLNVQHDIQITKENNVYIVAIDNENVIENAVMNVGNLNGSVGISSFQATGKVFSLDVSVE